MESRHTALAREARLEEVIQMKAFSYADLEEFRLLLSNVGERSYNEITKFFDDKYNSKMPNYDKELSYYREYYEEKLLQLAGQRTDLKALFDRGKKKEARLEDLNERLVLVTRERRIKSSIFRFLKSRREETISREIVAILLLSCKTFEENGTVQESLSESTSITHAEQLEKNGLQLKLKRRVEGHSLSIKEEYMSIINLLQNKILELEDNIKKKKLSKQEFSFQLNKSLLKTISNLSMEVINLNQVNVKDKMSDLSITNNYMDQLNHVVSSKMAEIERLKVLREREDTHVRGNY